MNIVFYLVVQNKHNDTEEEKEEQFRDIKLLWSEDNERNKLKKETPYMRTNPDFISSFQGFHDCNVYDKLQRYEIDVNDNTEGSGFNIGKIIFFDIHILKSDPLTNKQNRIQNVHKTYAS